MRKTMRGLATAAAMLVGSSLQSKEMLTPQQASAKEVAKDKKRRKDTLEETTAGNGNHTIWAQPQPIFIPSRSQKVKRKRMLKRMSN